MTRLMIALIRAYQTLLSPVLPPSCRFTPSCSVYAIDAYREHGFWRGTRLAAGRLLRCGPWSAGGFDPVPKRQGHTSPHRFATHAVGAPATLGTPGIAGSPETRLHICREGE